MKFLPGLVRVLLTGATVFMLGTALADVTFLNVSYDVTRELYKDINPAFIEHWAKTTGEQVAVEQSHGGSSKQALAVANPAFHGGRGLRRLGAGAANAFC